MTWEDTLTTVSEETAGLGWIHTIPNAAVLTAGLLYGDGDFTRTITLDRPRRPGHRLERRDGGLGGRVLAEAIPAQWKDPLEDTVRSAVFGFDGVRISELAARTLALMVTDAEMEAEAEAEGPSGAGTDVQGLS